MLKDNYLAWLLTPFSWEGKARRLGIWGSFVHTSALARIGAGGGGITTLHLVRNEFSRLARCKLSAEKHAATSACTEGGTPIHHSSSSMNHSPYLSQQISLSLNATQGILLSGIRGLVGEVNSDHGLSYHLAKSLPNQLALKRGSSPGMLPCRRFSCWH